MDLKNWPVLALLPPTEYVRARPQMLLGHQRLLPIHMAQSFESHHPSGISNLLCQSFVALYDPPRIGGLACTITPHIKSKENQPPFPFIILSFEDETFLALRATHRAINSICKASLNVHALTSTLPNHQHRFHVESTRLSPHDCWYAGPPKQLDPL